MSALYRITREISIDAGHRVPTHGSKCANLHGHRYRIIAHCISAKLHSGGEQKDMVLDFGFLKDVMMVRIDTPCDHGMTLWIGDPMLPRLLQVEQVKHLEQRLSLPGATHCLLPGVTGGQTKLCVVPFIPTAEKLAEWWFHEMEADVIKQSRGLAALEKVEVFETPNCSAVFTPPGTERSHG